MINIRVIDGLHFTAMSRCGQWWQGMRHSEDVRIVVDRAMDHAKSCEKCAAMIDAAR